MTVRLLTYDGRQYLMPTLLTWIVRRTGGVPADELEVEAVYDGELQEVLPDVYRFAAYQDDELILRGVVDEYEVEASAEGLLLRLAGRGMAALLLDNEAEAATYQQATTAEILRTHVTPWGSPVTRWRDIRCQNYRVTSGIQPVEGPVGFHQPGGRFTPWFTAAGELVVEPLAGSGERRAIDGTAPVLSCIRRERRYGIISEMLLRTGTSGSSRQSPTSAFSAGAGSGGRYCTCPAAVPMTRCATPEITRSPSPRRGHGRRN